MTVDGAIDQAGDWFSPAGSDDHSDSTDIEATLREHMAVQDALDYWPKQEADEAGGVVLLTYRLL